VAWSLLPSRFLWGVDPQAPQVNGAGVSGRKGGGSVSPLRESTMVVDGSVWRRGGGYRWDGA